nr:MAG TPA: hypothetical protein [Caudoviricetes sp.]
MHTINATFNLILISPAVRIRTSLPQSPLHQFVNGDLIYSQTVLRRDFITLLYIYHIYHIRKLMF